MGLPSHNLVENTCRPKFSYWSGGLSLCFPAKSKGMKTWRSEAGIYNAKPAVQLLKLRFPMLSTKI